MDAFLGPAESLADTKSDDDEEEDKTGLHPLIYKAATVHSCDDGVIGNDTGPSDWYNREAELAAMSEDDV